MSAATKYRIPERGDRVVLTVSPAAVGLHDRVQEDQRFIVEGTPLVDEHGLVLDVRPEGDDTTFRLRHNRVRLLRDD